MEKVKKIYQFHPIIRVNKTCTKASFHGFLITFKPSSTNGSFTASKTENCCRKYVSIATCKIEMSDAYPIHNHGSCFELHTTPETIGKTYLHSMFNTKLH